MPNDQALIAASPVDDQSIILNLIWFSILIVCSFLSILGKRKAEKDKQMEDDGFFSVLSLCTQGLAYAVMFDLIPQPFHSWLGASLPQAGQVIHAVTVWVISLTSAFIWFFLPLFLSVLIQPKIKNNQAKEANSKG